MKFIIFILFYLSANAHAFNIVNGEVQPISRRNYPLKDFIRDYAKLMKLNITYPSNLIKDKETVHIEFNSKVSIPEFKNVFYEAISNLGYSPLEENNVLWLVPAREMRYMYSSVYTDQNFPRNASFSTVLYKLKYPLSSEVARNLRPFVSRYGRVIDLSDARTLIFHDQGDIIERLIATIKSMDNEAAYHALINQAPEVDKDKNNPLKEKVLELEMEKKMLETMYLKLKDESQ